MVTSGGQQDYPFPKAGPVKGLICEGENVRHVDIGRGAFHEETITVTTKVHNPQVESDNSHHLVHYLSCRML